mmetsp:Transcript_25433/g.49707  ORF Transcript_25433/g.49707 Transcript_25433/m.49707 type:complete len:342 (-) Transcript_25433:579-1604(-)
MQRRASTEKGRGCSCSLTHEPSTWGNFMFVHSLSRGNFHRPPVTSSSVQLAGGVRFVFHKSEHEDMTKYQPPDKEQRTKRDTDHNRQKRQTPDQTCLAASGRCTNFADKRCTRTIPLCVSRNDRTALCRSEKVSVQVGRGLCCGLTASKRTVRPADPVSFKPNGHDLKDLCLIQKQVSAKGSYHRVNRGRDASIGLEFFLNETAEISPTWRTEKFRVEELNSRIIPTPRDPSPKRPSVLQQPGEMVSRKLSFVHLHFSVLHYGLPQLLYGLPGVVIHLVLIPTHGPAVFRSSRRHFLQRTGIHFTKEGAFSLHLPDVTVVQETWMLQNLVPREAAHCTFCL